MIFFRISVALLECGNDPAKYIIIHFDGTDCLTELAGNLFFPRPLSRTLTLVASTMIIDILFFLYLGDHSAAR
ncbi:MAG: hypothetical protein U9O82_06505 [Thermodesulfobacteriota bacterium]|nr:hypothetical protein [Thermodesulfobacteriota bacterium]